MCMLLMPLSVWRSQHVTALHATAHHSKAQHSTAQHNTAHSKAVNHTTRTPWCKTVVNFCTSPTEGAKGVVVVVLAVVVAMEVVVVVDMEKVAVD